MQNLEETVESITKEIKTKFDEMKGKVFNYQNAINKLQGEKQQMYQSMNQLKFDKSPAYGTPVTKAHSTSIKQHPLKESSSSKETEKSEAMIDYLRAEVSHLRDKNRSYEAKIEAMQKQTETVKTNNSQLSDFMSEILRSGKDLIYQLCSDPQLSEAFFYKEDSKFHGMESKYWLDVCKIFDLSIERIVDLRTILDQKQQIISELDKKIIELRVKFNQQDQLKHQQQQSVNKELEENFENLDIKCREFASNLKVLSGELEKEKIKCQRLESENKYLKDHIKHKVDNQNNQEMLQASFESRLKMAKEEGIRLGRREGIMDSKINDYIEKYKQEIEQQGEKIVQLESSKERLEFEYNRLKTELSNVQHQVISERNLQQSLSKEIEDLTMEVKDLRLAQEDD